MSSKGKVVLLPDGLLWAYVLTYDHDSPEVYLYESEQDMETGFREWFAGAYSDADDPDPSEMSLSELESWLDSSSGADVWFMRLGVQTRAEGWI